MDNPNVSTVKAPAASEAPVPAAAAPASSQAPLASIETTKSHPGPQIDPNNVDPDGMPLAPPEVLTAKEGAYVVFGPAKDQATSFHTPTAAEKTQIIAILNAFYQSKINGGPSAATTKVILANAKSLGLQVCRVKYTKDNAPASVLLFYTVHGKKDYSGPFMMLKETKSSNFTIYGPHDDTDETFAVTKLGMINSYALACFSNGHNRGKVSGGDINLYRESDWAHANSVELNLGDVAIQRFAELYPDQVAILFNGIVNPNKSMVHCLNPQMEAVFKDAMIKSTHLTAADFTGYPVWFTTNVIFKGHKNYLTCEVPVETYKNNRAIVTDIAVAMEANPWCWDVPKVAQAVVADTTHDFANAVLQAAAKPAASLVAPNVVPISVKIKFAPFVPPVTATLKLVAVALAWKDNPGSDLGKVTNCAKAVAATFKRISRGYYNFDPVVSFRIPVALSHTTQNVEFAVNDAKKVLADLHGIKDDGSVSFMFVNNGAQAYSHTGPGSYTSNLLYPLDTTGCHEVGRQGRLQLGASDAIIKGVLVDQADGTSFMSNKASDRITASQAYQSGYLNGQVALYDNPNETMDVTLVPYDSDDDKSVKAVLFTDLANNPVTLSRPTFHDGVVTNTLHVAHGAFLRGSTRLLVFGHAANYGNLSFTVLSETGGTAKIRISPVKAPALTM